MNNNIFDKIVAEIESGNFRNAILNCDEILNENPDNRSIYEIRSGCYYALGDYDSAIRDLTYSIVKAKGGDDIKEEVIGLYSKRGKIYLKKNDWLKASEDYKKILILDQNLPETQNSLALCYRKMGAYIEALYHASQAIRLNNKYAEAYNNRANINISLEKYKEAIADYTHSLELNPLSANVYFNRGSIYYDILNDKINAIEDFLMAININPNFKDELIKHYPELTNILDKIEENLEGKESTLDEIADNIAPPEIIVPKQEAPEIGFSLDDFDLLFKESKESNKDAVVPLSAQEIKKTDDIVIPEFDMKSIFTANNSIEETLPAEEFTIPDRPIISDSIKSLHDEIETNNNKDKDTSILMGGVKFGEMSGFENKEPVFDTNPDSKHMIKSAEEKRSFLRSPFFFIIIIVLMAIIILLSVLKFFKTQENQIVNTPVKVKTDSNLVKNSDTLKEEIKDTVEKKEPEKVKEPEKKTEEVKKEEPPKQKAELTTKNLGFISDKKQFVLFSEPDGYYVQTGSYKDKQTAEEKLKILEKNNIKGKVIEVDLKEKGIFYRVRAGVYSTPEEAKEKTIKME